MQSFGVYVPEQDAAWETQDNGTLYDDLLERYNRCDAVECLCPDGREADEDYTIWEIVSIIWVIFNSLMTYDEIFYSFPSIVLLFAIVKIYKFDFRSYAGVVVLKEFMLNVETCRYQKI